MSEKRPKARILDPILDAEEVVWLGTEPGTIRKVYRILKTPYFNVGMAMFTPERAGQSMCMKMRKKSVIPLWGEAPRKQKGTY